MAQKKHCARFSRLIAGIMLMVTTVSLAACGIGYGDIDVTTGPKDDILRNTIEKYISKPEYSERFKGDIPVSTGTTDNMANYEMPDINAYAPSVKGGGETDAELFLLSEGSEGLDAYAKEIAEAFNKEGLKSKAGETVSVTVRPIESSLGMDFITSEAYIPDGCIAINTLAENKESGMVDEVGYFAGDEMAMAVKEDKVSDEKWEGVIDTVVEKRLSVYCPSPATNLTGLNFLVALDKAGKLDQDSYLDLQDNIYYANFHSQMLQPAKNNGADVVVTSRQQIEEAGMTGYKLFPMGISQNHPVYITKKAGDKKAEVIRMFMEYVSSSTARNSAKAYGFSAPEESKLPAKYDDPETEKTISYWKKNKGGTRDVVTIFVADVSGSMADQGKYDALISSLKTSMQYIDEESTVGLISYNNRIAINHMPAKFTKEEQEYFSGAIDNIVEPQGNTATYNALLEAVKLIRDEEISGKHKNGIKPTIILLSDGCTNHGFSFSNIKELVKLFGYRVYTIGYGNDADEDELKKVAESTGGMYIKSSANDIPFFIKTLFTNEL